MYAPSPSQRVGHKTTDRGAHGRSGTEDDVQVALPETTLTQRDKVGHQDGAHRIDATAANAGYGSGGDELRDVATDSTAQGPEAEEDIGEEEALLPPEDVAELAIQRLAARQGEKVPAAMVSLMSQPGMSIGR